MAILYSKKALKYALWYALLLTLIGIGLLLKSLTFIDAILLAWVVSVFLGGYGIYYRFVLRSEPWGSLAPDEKRTRCFWWSLLISECAIGTLWIIAKLIGIDIQLILLQVGFVIIMYYTKSKISEGYLEIALKDGGT